MSSELSMDERIKRIRIARWKARTDLRWFANEILGYRDVSEEVHGPLLSRLQKFPSPDSVTIEQNDRFVNGTWEYRPLIPMMDLPGKRRLLILDSRGCLKTTLNAISHTLQWIINYPDIAIAIIQANLDKAEDIISEIKNHFTKNPRFRELFPEHCPDLKKVESFGTQAEFTTRARGRAVTRKEPTVRGASIEKGLAGSHFDLMKYSDIVDENNSNNAEICKTIFRKFVLSQNLLVSPRFWIDVEGTRYDEKDTYGEIIRGQEMLPEEKRDWNIFVRGIFKKDTGGRPRNYTYAEVRLPDLLDENKLPISIWPDRFPADGILSEYAMDPYLVSCQKFNFPNHAAGGQTIFPVDDKYPAWKSRQDFEQRVLVSHYEMRVDSAQTIGDRSNHSVITIGAWDNAGRLYIVDIRRGKWLAAELIAQIIAAYTTYQRKSRNGFVRVAIEETAYVTGLMLGFRQYCDQRGLHIPLETVKIDNTKSKTENIVRTLQYPYMTKQIIFLDDLKEKEVLLSELSGMPKPLSDDILDTLAAFYKGKEWLGRLNARQDPTHIEQVISNTLAPADAYRQRQFARMLGLTGDFDSGSDSTHMHPDLAKTGGL